MMENFEFVCVKEEIFSDDENSENESQESVFLNGHKSNLGAAINVKEEEEEDSPVQRELHICTGNGDAEEEDELMGKDSLAFDAMDEKCEVTTDMKEECNEQAACTLQSSSVDGESSGLSTEAQLAGLSSGSVVTSTGTLTCHTCGKVFGTAKSYCVHLKQHENITTYNCPTCRKILSTKKSLARHLRLHTGETLFVCNVCNRGFNDGSKFSIHLHTHSGKKPLKCKECGKNFLRKESLHQHLRIHTGEKPFQCNVCNRTFSQRSSLYRHGQTHSDDKPFQCDVCNKSFAWKLSFDLHVRTHTNERPYTCDLCNDAFRHKSSLKRHMNKQICKKDS